MERHSSVRRSADRNTRLFKQSQDDALWRDCVVLPRVCVCVLPYVFDKILQVEFLSPLSHNVSLHFSTKQIVQKNKKNPQLWASVRRELTLKTRHVHGSKTNGRFGKKKEKKRLKHVGVLRLKSRLRRLLLTPTLLTHSWAHAGSEFCFYLLFWDGQLPAVCWPSWPSTEQPSSTYMCCGTSSGPSLICQTSNKPYVRMFCNNIRVF